MNITEIIVIGLVYGLPLLIVGGCAFDCWKREIQLRRGEL